MKVDRGLSAGQSDNLCHLLLSSHPKGVRPGYGHRKRETGLKFGALDSTNHLSPFWLHGPMPEKLLEEGTGPWQQHLSVGGKRDWGRSPGVSAGASSELEDAQGFAHHPSSPACPGAQEGSPVLRITGLFCHQNQSELSFPCLPSITFLCRNAI